MLNQDEDLRQEIRRKKARIEEINLFLARLRPTGGAVNSTRNLIEERLHLEEIVAELEAFRARLRVQNADRSFRWEDIDQRILSAKTNHLAEEMHQRVAEARRSIAYETAKRGNAAGYLPRWFDFNEQLADEWAKRIYVAHCDTWTEQNRTISPSFIRLVGDRAIAPLLAARKSSAQHEAELRATRINDTGNPQNSAAIGEWTRSMSRLVARWNRKLEADAAAAEHRTATATHATHQDFRGGIILRACEASAIYCSRLEQQALESDSAISVPQEPIPREPAVPSTQTSSSSKPGRTAVRPVDFVNLAGKLWLDAKEQSETANVTAEQLKGIASRLDQQRYTPPARYLEDNCARELKAFNSKNSNSRVGPIQTWSALVALGDKDHLRGMRKLLSRCAQTLARGSNSECSVLIK